MRTVFGHEIGVTAVKAKGGIHFGWFVVLMCFLIQGAAFGIVTNTRGLFFGSMCAELGVQLGELTRCYIFYAAATVVSIPIAAKAIPRANLRVLLSVFGAVIALSVFLCGSCRMVYEVYILTAVQGLCTAFLVAMTTNLLVNNWIQKYKGLAFAFCGASASIFGALFSIAANNMIIRHGWRSGFRTLGIIVFLMIVPATACFAVFKPENMGMHPYGWEETEDAVNDGSSEKTEGVPKKDALRSASFVFLITGIFVSNLMAQVSQIFPGYGESIGLGTKAAYLTTTAMLASLVLKLISGRVSDRAGVHRALTGTNIVGAAGGLILLLFGTAAGIVPFVACGLISAPVAVASVLCPLWVMRIFGQRDFAALMAYVQIATYLGTPLGVLLMGSIVDRGGYNAFRMACFVLVAILLVSSELSFVFSKRLEKSRVIS
ncbi:MAG: MFS transporter [Oscillospiraceae bacterium]|nr:MFS transporter [Oscillospiraceae bacterium]